MNNTTNCLHEYFHVFLFSGSTLLHFEDILFYQTFTKMLEIVLKKKKSFEYFILYLLKN